MHVSKKIHTKTYSIIGMKRNQLHELWWELKTKE